MPTSFKDLVLSPEQIEILETIKHEGSILRKKIYNHPEYEFLLYYSLIISCREDISKYQLSPKAEMYLRYIKKEEMADKKRIIHDWRISIFGTIGGAIAGFLTSIIFWLVTK